MELRTLQYFLTVAREENITRASEVLHITQPTLSRQMKQLEQELGTELFVRGRNFALTEAGMLLRRRAEEVVDMMYKIESEIETAGEVGSVISINSGASCGLTIEGAVDLFEDSKMVFKPLNPRLELTAVLAWKRFHSLSGAAAKFLEYFKEYLKSKQ